MICEYLHVDITLTASAGVYILYASLLPFIYKDLGMYTS